MSMMYHFSISQFTWDKMFGKMVKQHISGSCLKKQRTGKFQWTQKKKIVIENSAGFKPEPSLCYAKAATTMLFQHYC